MHLAPSLAHRPSLGLMQQRVDYIVNSQRAVGTSFLCTRLGVLRVTEAQDASVI